MPRKRLKFYLTDLDDYAEIRRDIERTGGLPARTVRATINLPYFITIVVGNDPAINEVHIQNNYGVTVPCVQDYANEHEMPTVILDNFLHPRNSITNSYSLLIRYLTDNIDEDDSLASRNVIDMGGGSYIVNQRLYSTPVDLVVNYSRRYLPKLRSMERLLNIEFVNKTKFDSEFKLKCTKRP